MTGNDIWVLALDGSAPPQPVLNSLASESQAEVSPDGRWLAYQSDESGLFEVYVRPFPGPGAGIPISTGGGIRPQWSADGRELFYLTLSGETMMVTEVFGGSVLTVGSPRPLFASHSQLSEYAVSPEGQRFLRIQSAEPPEAGTQIEIVLNRQEELKRLVPRR